MPLKKSALYSSLWQSCDELRGGMDASQYKDYVLTLLFMKYVSDKYAGQPDAVVEIPKGGSFADMAKLKGDKEIGDKINKIIAKLADANDLRGVIDQADFNDEDKLGRGKEMQDRLSKLIAIFESLDFRANRATGDDLLGDAYEYLMRHFATESGKSKGQFYTPAEVSRIMAKVVGIGPSTRQDQTIYDPTCGSGSLLLKAADEAPRGMTIYGQEMDNATWALARMNMILHGHATADLRRGNTLAAPQLTSPSGRLKTFDFAVANPPFSTKAWSNGFDPKHDEYHRFEYGVPPEKNGDYAFLEHLIASLKPRGKGAIILPHGVLFRGNAEADIRRNIVRAGLIRGIIGLPANLFYGTGIPACIVVIDKENAGPNRGIFMIDASAGFMKDGPKNRLRDMDIHRIVDTFTRQLEVPKYSRLVPFEEIERNDFNLNLPRYIDSTMAEDVQDIAAHLQGGIPVADVDALAPYWSVCPGLRTALFRDNRPGYVDLAVEGPEIRHTIHEHPEFVAFVDCMNARFAEWRERSLAKFKSLQPGFDPKVLIAEVSEDLLMHYKGAPLVDPYDVYQHLMDYWTETMQDDCYIIAADGWTAETRRIIEKDKNGKSKDKGWTCDLVPKPLIVARYFGDEQAAIDALVAKLEEVISRRSELEEEHSAEDAFLGALDKISRPDVKARLDNIEDDNETHDEAVVLECWLRLSEDESALKRLLKEKGAALDLLAYERYSALREAEVKTLVVNDKWMTHLSTSMDGDLAQESRLLMGRIHELAERYATPLPQLTGRVASLASKVEEHLASMGMMWK